MNDALYIAATGMHTQQRSVDTIANNLANVNTPGFKKGRVAFEDMVYRGLSGASPAQLAAPVSRGLGVGMLGITKVFSAGELKKTDQPLDVAIDGEGFFEVTGTDGMPAYSRGGSLMVDKDGMLATAEGQVLKPGIHVGTDAKEITLKSDGRVLVRRNGSRPYRAGAFLRYGWADCVGQRAVSPVGAIRRRHCRAARRRWHGRHSPRVY
jgi:flagellar basal-body rod protein FlgG